MPCCAPGCALSTTTNTTAITKNGYIKVVGADKEVGLEIRRSSDMNLNTLVLCVRSLRCVAVSCRVKWTISYLNSLFWHAKTVVTASFSHTDTFLALGDSVPGSQ